jgi:radical SAM/Cys-rich protein
VENNFKDVIISINPAYIRRIDLQTLQVNLGNLCNQKCIHCHIDAGPNGKNIMSKRVMDDIVKFLSKKDGLILDITGGCPEFNPDFKYLIEKADKYVQKIIVRNNLTIFFEDGMEDLPLYYKENNIELICSMPCYTKENIEKQRGEGVCEKSIRGFKLLNELGYGEEDGLELNLVYNPGGPFLPTNEASLEEDYKRILYEQFGIVFNHLLTMTNVPIGRFEQFLKVNGNYDAYMKLLIDNFDKDNAQNIMCRNLLSVGWDGRIYDCDFNQALGLVMRNLKGDIMEIGSLKPEDLITKEIIFESHCFSCTAGAGSSCSGSLSGKANDLSTGTETIGLISPSGINGKSHIDGDYT